MPSHKTVDATERIHAMYSLMGEDVIESFIIDLLTDIQHWCDLEHTLYEKATFLDFLLTAQNHFNAEK